MTNLPDDDLERIAREALAELRPDPTDDEIEALLADPAFAPIAARAVKPYDKALTAKGREEVLRTLAMTFLADPRAADLLAQVRAGQPADASRTVSTGGEAGAAPGAAQGRKP
jgi:hypothetical protein